MTSIATKFFTVENLINLREGEWKGFLRWAFVWIFLINAGFMALWFVGSPPRFLEIMVIAVVGLIVKNTSLFVRYAYFVVAVIWTTLNFIAEIFNLDLPRLLDSMQFIFAINIASSSIYLIATFSMIGILAAGYYVMKGDSRFSRWWLYPFALTIAFSLAAIDFTLSKELRGHYKRPPPTGASFSSAMQQTDFANRANGKRNIVLIMVESLGRPVNNAEMERLLFRNYETSDAVKSRYEISIGFTPFYGSTTRGEIREMCGRWGEYYPLLEKPDEACLPNIMKNSGYETIAMHTFNGEFFDREKWYPNFGFNQQFFAEDLIEKGVSACGGVFAGACDRDVPSLIAKTLKSSSKPTFLYWLTVNSHLPVLQGHNLNVENCERISRKLAENYPHICSQFSVWNDIDKALIGEITASDFPETDILLVGDHMPPFFDRHHRKQIDPGSVPWLYLKHK